MTTYLSQHLNHDGQVEAHLNTYEGENWHALAIVVRNGNGDKVAEFTLFADKVEQFGNLAVKLETVAN